jgi:hypothetical protein
LKKSISAKLAGTCLITFFFFFGYSDLWAEDFVLLKKAAPPEIVAMDGKAKLLYGEFIRRQLQQRHPTLKTIIVGDKRYMFITEKWFRDVVDWTEHFIKQQVPELDNLEDLPIAYEATFTMLMSNMANIAVAKRYNVKGSVLIGLLVAKSKNPWGTIRADGMSRVYVVGLTENGSIIYDISTRQVIAGKEFPNREYISGIML